jgi:acetoin:2,6-dichlorophenolindophenol oxidoreductase subunit beta
MTRTTLSEAVDDALAQAMTADPRILFFGEDIQGLHSSLYLRFSAERVINTPISESGFLGAAVAAAMGGLHPVVEIMLVDFIGVTMDALLNQAAKVEAFSGGRWKVPLVVRTSIGGGYGDGGQHEQSLGGWLAHIPGLAVVCPSTPLDAGGLMLGALDYGSPVVFQEHKLLSEMWLDALGRGGRRTVSYNVPEAAFAELPKTWQPLPIGKAALLREGRDLSMFSTAVGVHRALEAADLLQKEGISAGVIDLRTISPLDKETVYREVKRTSKMLIIDEDYEGFGLSGELAAVGLEAGLQFKYQRVCTQTTIPYARHLEDQTLPNVDKIMSAAHRLCQ